MRPNLYEFMFKVVFSKHTPSYINPLAELCIRYELPTFLQYMGVLNMSMNYAGFRAAHMGRLDYLKLAHTLDESGLNAPSIDGDQQYWKFKYNSYNSVTYNPRYEHGYQLPTIMTRVNINHNQMVQYVSVAEVAAETGHLDCLQYAHQHGCALTDRVLVLAKASGSVECINFVIETQCEIQRQYALDIEREKQRALDIQHEDKLLDIQLRELITDVILFK